MTQQRVLLLDELQRQLDALVDSHADALAAAIVSQRNTAQSSETEKQSLRFTTALSAHEGRHCSSVAMAIDDSRLLHLVRRLEQTTVTFVRRCFADVVHLLLAWTDVCAHKHVALWLSAHLLAATLDALSSDTASGSSKMQSACGMDTAMLHASVEGVLDKCFDVLQECWQAHTQATSVSDNGSSFFAFKSKVVQAKPSATPQSSDTATLAECVAGKWRCVLTWVARVYSLAPIRLRLQRELAQPTLLTLRPSSQQAQAKDHAFVFHLRDMELGLHAARRSACFTRNVLLATDAQTAIAVPLTQRLNDAALLLKTLMPLLHKPTKSAIRLEMFALVARVLERELLRMDAKTLALVFSTAHASEWNTCVSELHATAMKSAAKRHFVSVAWDLRTAVLCIAPNDIFSRYWKDDVLALLRLQSQHSKDSASSQSASATLATIGACFAQVLQRHFVMDRTLPTEHDCMEIINTTQAWCFFSSAQKKSKSLDKFRARTLPVLVRLTVAIAAYNMTYAIQSHVRRLLTEAESIVDEKKLVGLEALLAMCRYSSQRDEQAPVATPVLRLDAKTLRAHFRALGELIGPILMECNTNLGHELLIDAVGSAASSSASSQAAGASDSSSTALPLSSVSAASLLSMRFLRDDYKRAVALQTFGAALKTLEFLFTSLELSADQTMLLVAKASIHADAYVRMCASAALHALVLKRDEYHAATVFRGLTDFVLRMTGNQPHVNDSDACCILVTLLRSLLQATSDAGAHGHACWSSTKAKLESLQQIEAVCVYVLAHNDVSLRREALATLAVTRSADTVAVESLAGGSSPNEQTPTKIVGSDDTHEARVHVLDVVDAMETELQRAFFAVLPEWRACSDEHDAHTTPSTTPEPQHSRSNALALLESLATDTQVARHSFRWTVCLSMLVARLVECLPEVTVYIWSDVVDKIHKLEPLIATASAGESELASDVARWRNLSVVATATACPSIAAIAGSAHARDHDSQQNRASEHSSTTSRASSASLTASASVISSAAVASLLKRLGRYFKSASLEQRKAAVLALGSAHASVLPVVIEVLAKYETEAFASLAAPGADASQQQATTSSSAASSALGSTGKASRASKGKPHTKTCSLVMLQWALGRCYRLLLERLLRTIREHPTDPGPGFASSLSAASVDRVLLAARSFLDKMRVVVEQFGRLQLALESSSVSFMIQHDLCASLRLLVQLQRERPLASMTSATATQSEQQRASTTSSKLFPASTREQLFYFAMPLCQSVGAFAAPALSATLCASGFFDASSHVRSAWLEHCDVFGDSDGGDSKALVLSVHWVDDVDWAVALASDSTTRAESSASHLIGLCQRYFLHQSAFAAMAALVQLDDSESIFASPIQSDAPVFQWLDDCFCVDTGATCALSTLQAHGQVSSSSASTSNRHISSLQTLCADAIRALLTKDFRTFGPICLEKALFTQPSGDQFCMAKHYFRAFGDCVSEFDAFWAASVRPESEATEARDQTAMWQLLARVFYVAILHIGIEDDAVHRRMALSRLKQLLASTAIAPNGAALVDALATLHCECSSDEQSLSVLQTQVISRSQVVVSSLLATHFASLAPYVSASLLRFITFSASSQQRKLFAVVLPWLGEVRLATASRVNMLDASDDTALVLSLLFRLTKNLSASCTEQLEHAWLTLAFTSRPTESTTSSDDRATTNLAVIVRFLYLQRSARAHLATSKTVLWWLSRWQLAAFDVIVTLIDLVTIHRRQSTALSSLPSLTELPTTTGDASRRGSFSDDATAHMLSFPLYAVGVLLALFPDSTCHLLAAQHQETVSAVTDVAVQIAHSALLMLFCSIDKRSNTVDALESSRTVQALDLDGGDSILHGATTNDCLLVLRNVLPLLDAPMESIETFLNELARVLEEREAGPSKQHSSAKTDDPQPCCRTFESAVATFVRSGLSLTEVLVWSEECVKECALAIARFSTETLQQSEDGEATRTTVQVRTAAQARMQNTQCLCFALKMHQLLAAPFHGDVFLTLMELLHHALDEQHRDPQTANSLVQECLRALQSMVALMPTAKLVLYPQIVWVCMALLNHSAASVAYRSAVVELLLEVVSTPHFFTNAVIHDVLLLKRPQQWARAQSSVLRAIALNAFGHDYRCDDDCEQRLGRAEQLVAHALVFPTPVLGVEAHEHAAICTTTLLLSLVARTADTVQLQQIAADLSDLWRDIEGESAQQLCELFARYATESAIQASQLSPTAIDEVLLVSFADSFVQHARTVEEHDPSADVWTVSVEILVSAAAASARLRSINTRKEQTRLVSREHRVALAALRLLEELLCEIERCSVVWHIPPTLAAALAALMQAPLVDDTLWDVIARILCFATPPMGSETSRSQRSPTSLNALTVSSKPTLTLVGIDTMGSSAPMTTIASAPKPETAAPTSIKKESLQTARKFMHLVTGRSSSASAKASVSFRESNNSNNNNSSSSEHNSSSSSSSIVGGHVSGADTSAQDPVVRAGTPQKAALQANGPSDARPPSTPTRSKLFRL